MVEVVEFDYSKPFLFQGGLSIDDRGSVSFVNAFDFENVKRFYMVENHENGFVRAWHGHKKEGKYVYVPKGTALVGVVPLDADRHNTALVEKFHLSDKKPQVLWIPPGYYNGFMNREEDTRIMFFSTSILEESLDDDFRLPYDYWFIWYKKEYR